VSRFSQRLYFSSPVWLQQIMLWMYGRRLRRIRYGGIHRRILAELLQGQWATASDVQEAQLAKLNETLQHARTTVPFYRHLPERRLSRLTDLEQLPILTKADVQAAGKALVSGASRHSRLLEIHTGGTTGKPLAICCDAPTLQRNYAFFTRFRSWAGISEESRVAVFAGRTIVAPEQTSPPYWRRNPAANTLLLSSYHLSPATLRVYVDALAAFQPALIDSYPSSLEPVARFVVDHGIETIRPRSIITSSETLHPSVRQLFEQAFACPVFDHYGAAEMAALITQCERGTYHANPEFGVVEVLQDGKPAGPGEAGEIVATGFINPVMPLIRYATGDQAIRAVSDVCPCGRAFPVIERIVGRLDDLIVTPEGRRIGRLDPIFKAVAGLHETRIVQDRSDHVRVEVVTGGGPLPAQQRAALHHELANRLGPLMDIEIVETAAIPRTASGKLRTVVNLVHADARSRDDPADPLGGGPVETPPPPVAATSRTQGNGGRPKLLVLCHTVPYPPDGGVWIRTYNVLRLLAERFDLTMLCFERVVPRGLEATHNLAQAIQALKQLGAVEVWRIPELHSGPKRVWNHLRSLLRGEVFTYYRHQSPALTQRLRQLLASTAFDLVHVDSLDLYGYLPFLRDLPVVCVHHNVESRLLRDRAQAERSLWRRVYLTHQARLMERVERHWCPRVALNVAVSEQDAQALARLAPAGKYAVVPNGVDTGYFVHADQPGRSQEGLVFVGSNTWLPNSDALRYFCDEILPRIRQVAGEVPVRWVGSATDAERAWFQDRHGVEVTGYVPDVRSYIARARCYVVPLRIGGGTRLKILDAWSMQAAVVSTSVGCAGLRAGHEDNILIADTPEDFAAAVLRVLRDDPLRNRLGQNGRSLAEREYSWQVIGRRMIDEYMRIAAAGAPRATVNLTSSVCVESAG
jgi:phenylacetate-CoA ligase